MHNLNIAHSSMRSKTTPVTNSIDFQLIQPFKNLGN
jgi:hypothetical protein